MDSKPPFYNSFYDVRLFYPVQIDPAMKPDFNSNYFYEAPPQKKPQHAQKVR